MEKVLENLEKYILYTIVFLLPIIVLPIFANPFDLAKLSVLTFGVALILFIKVVRIITEGKLDFNIGNLDFPVFLLGFTYLLSAILRTPNKMDAFLLPGSASAVVAGALLYFLINQLKKEEKAVSAGLLFFSGLVFAVVLLLASGNILSKIPQLPTWVQATSFNLAGGYLPAILFLAVLVPLGISRILAEKEIVRKIFLGVSLAVIGFALVVGVINVLPGKPFSPKFLDFNTSWNIAIDSLKESPVLGMGPGNYLTAFNRFRPLSYNTNDLWAIKFTTANDFYLTVFTETGLLGAAALILLLTAFYKYLKRQFKEKKLADWTSPANSNLFSLSLLIVLLAFFPTTVLLIAVLFILFSLVSETRKTSLNLTTQVTGVGEGTHQVSQKIASRLPSLLVTLPVLIAVLLFAYRGSRILAAEAKYKQALNALVQNKATETYDLMREAINLNPLVDRYHTSYSQINLALANAIAGNEEITDNDRAMIAQLIQQAIREAKSTVALNPLRAGNWEILARMYQAIIPFAEGADLFAIQSFRQAVALDPVNPNLRIALGGVHYARGSFDNAVQVFELATVAKPDLANGHYNLAFALREKGDIDRAISEMTIVLSLVDRGTNDYEMAKSALEDLEAKRATTKAAEGTELTSPQPAGEPVIQPPLELPEEAQPPEAPITPTPTEGLTPTATPEPTPTP